jgi:hypothetical protein
MSKETISINDGYQQKLIGLRARIDSLPPEKRPHLYALADAISRELRQLEESTASGHESQ